ncbi:brachyurin [Teleopsis dalmanni]|uniref:brachyurin n=1 Tax=Teleopsis dalmanni TaxID=139649 RepID=UPI0018CF300F|nr:brachyurin [Teleopsis dalmanni]
MKVVVAFLCLLALLSVLGENAVESRGIEGRIISGTPAALGQLPWQVILKRDEMDDLLCGGSIIANNWVLTAAHCTYGLSSIYLIFGTILLDDSKAVSMTSTSMYIHDNYSSATLNNDVSLIQLPQPLQFSNTIQPIALVPSTMASESFIGTVAIIAGFGLVDDEYMDFSQTLLYARVDIINNNECLSIFGADVVVKSTLCAKGDNGSNMSICSGDSGGPLIARDANGNYMQIGINSFVAQDMCTEGYPSGYVRLTSFLDYIQKITNINFS